MCPIAVVICAYSDERREQLGAAIGSVLNQRLRPERVVVVIDHNERLLRAIRASFPEVGAVANEGTQGLSGARNTGVRACASTDVIAFLDDDAVAEPDWLERLASHYADPAVVGVGGGVLPIWQSDRPSWFPEECQWVVGCSYRVSPWDCGPFAIPSVATCLSVDRYSKSSVAFAKVWAEVARTRLAARKRSYVFACTGIIPIR